MRQDTISRRTLVRRAARQQYRELRAGGRAQARLPLTFLGTYGDTKPAHEQGWQPHMWGHPLFMSGAVVAAGQAVHQAVNAGVLPSPVGFIPDAPFTATALGVLGIVGAGAGLLTTAGEKFTDWARAYFVGGPLTAGAYLASVSVSSPYSTPSLVAVAAGTAVSMGMYWKMRNAQDTHELAYVSHWAYPSTKETPQAPAPPAPLVAEEKDPELVKWTDALNDVGLKGCRARKRPDTPAGYAVLVRLPTSGKVSPENVEQKLPHLERALALPKDSLEYDVATNREGRVYSDRCWIHVDVANILEQMLEMPTGEEVHTPTTINDFFRIGTFIDGTPMKLRFREISALIIGVRGRGKTNLFHVLVHQLSRCLDVVLWAIDLKGGRAVKPWLKAWLDERVGRPVFDWVATTRAEASLMIHAAEALIGFRGNRSVGGSKITPTPEQPGVIVLVDETAALVGKHSGPKLPVRGPRWWANPTANQIASVLTSCVQLGRSEAVDFVLCSQRGTVTMMGGGDLKSQCEMRIGLGVTNRADASSVFQSDNVNARKLARLKNQKTRGSCLIENGDSPNHLCGKVWFYGDDAAMLRRIDRTATLHAMYPADLPMLEQQAINDALLALTSGECGYGVGPEDASAQRWSLDRAAHLYTDDLAPDWIDDDPGDSEHLGGLHDLDDPPAAGRSATATVARPRSAPPAGRPTSAAPAPRLGPSAPTYNRQSSIPASPAPAGPATPGPTDPAEDTRSDRYYVRRRDRDPGQPATAPDESQRDPDAERFQREFDDLTRFLATAPDADEPSYDTTDPEQRSRYEVMLDIIKDAGTTGLMAGSIMAEMVKRGRSWARRSELHPALRRAKEDDRLIVQPLERGKYYWHEYAPKREA